MNNGGTRLFYSRISRNKHDKFNDICINCKNEFEQNDEECSGCGLYSRHPIRIKN